MTERIPRPLILWLVPTMPGGRVLSATLLFGGVIILYWLFGMFEWGVDRTRLPLNLPVFFAALIAYNVAIFDYITEHARRMARRLSVAGAPVPDPVTELPATLVWALVGATLGVAHCFAIARFDVPRLLSLLISSTADAAVYAGTVVAWLVMTVVSASLVSYALFFRKLGADAPLELFDRSSVAPFSSFAVASTLAVVGAMALFPILWIGVEQAWVGTLPGVGVLLVSLVLLLVLPTAPIHRRLVVLKTAALARAQERINELRAGAGVTDPEHLQLLTTALAYRREVEWTNEWPFDGGIVFRFSFYLVIPPATWVGAALIENVVDMAL